MHAYRVLEVIGSGGFGAVYRAEREADGRLVALKMLHAEMAGLTEVATRLRDEARLLAMLDHPSIPEVYGLELIDERWTVVMELLEGVDLQGVVLAAAMPPRAALELAASVALALASAWERPGPDGAPLHLVHRDVKLSNVHLDVHGVARLLDFGVARAEFATREARSVGVTFGSRKYMAPERYDHVTSPPGDVYALGAVLFACLTQREFGRAKVHPERHQEQVDKARRHLEGKGTSWAPIAALVAQMLAFEAEERPSAAAVGERCQALAATLPGDDLVTYARDVVPPLYEQRERAAPDTLVGTVVEATRELVQLDSATGEEDPPEDTMAGLLEIPAELRAQFDAEEARNEPPPAPAPSPQAEESAAAVKGTWIGLGLLAVAVLALLWAVLSG